MYYGVDCYMSDYTAKELDLENSSLNIIEDRIRFSIGTFDVLPLKMNHDVYCLGFLIYSTVTKETLFFATDTYYIPYKIPPVEYIMVEANYDLEVINQQIADGDSGLEAAKPRLMKSHMGIDSTLLFLSRIDLSRTKRIYLLHLSGRNSDESDFKKRVIELTGIPTTIAEGETTI